MAEATSSNLRPKHSRDRISELPDEVLCHILSFLTTKEAVGTSLLASRWMYVWTCVPILHFEDDDAGPRVEFVDRVMTLHRLQCLKRFYLSLSGNYDPSHVNAWICAAFKRNLEELVLYLSFDIKLPQILYFEKLVVLKLWGLCVPDTLASVYFPSRKILHVWALHFLSNDCVEKILSGSPVLEDFEIYDDFFLDESTLCIHSSFLKKLKLGMSTKLNSVVAPKLEVLKLLDLEIMDRMMNLPSLVEAEIRVKQCFVKLQSLISNVKVLHLYLYFSAEYFEPSNYDFVSFGNLTHLDVGPVEKGWLILPTLLECSPNLEVLVVHMVHYEVIFSFRPEDVPRCMLCLKKIEFEGFKGSDKEVMKMIKYFLKHSMVLEEMKISWRGAEADVLNRLLMFPRASSRCQIVLSPPKKEN